MNESQIDGINRNLENIFYKLEGIEHFLREISEEGILGREIEDAIISVARSISKELDERYKIQENQESSEVS